MRRPISRLQAELADRDEGGGHVLAIQAFSFSCARGWAGRGAVVVSSRPPFSHPLAGPLLASGLFAYNVRMIALPVGELAA